MHEVMLIFIREGEERHPSHTLSTDCSPFGRLPNLMIL